MLIPVLSRAISRHKTDAPAISNAYHTGMRFADCGRCVRCNLVAVMTKLVARAYFGLPENSDYHNCYVVMEMIPIATLSPNVRSPTTVASSRVSRS